MDSPTPPQIFDRRRVRQRRDRMAAMALANPDSETDFLAPIMAERLLERLDDLDTPIANLLLIGAHSPGFAARLIYRGFAVTVVDPGPAFAAAADGLCCDEDQLLASGLEPGSFDVVLWNGGLDITNDVPGALVQCRRLLKPNGVLLGIAMGAGSLGTLRSAMRVIDTGPAVARFHPQIDVRAMGDLLQRCGYTLPMADHEILTVRFGNLGRLIKDLRASGLTNCLSGTIYPLNRKDWLALDDAFTACADPDGRISEQFMLLYFTGWAPASSVRS